MPIYVYECPVCHERLELMRSLANRDNPVHCPNQNLYQFEMQLVPAPFASHNHTTSWAQSAGKTAMRDLEGRIR